MATTKRTVTDETRARWRAAALKNQPSRHSTGPKTPAGKAQAVRNGKKRQTGELSHRELRALAKQMRAFVRQSAAEFKELEGALRRQEASQPVEGADAAAAKLANRAGGADGGDGAQGP
jgi:hypothetical protein